MVAPVLRGRARLRAKRPSGSGSSTWRGLSLRHNTPATYSAAEGQPFETVVADTDGIFADDPVTIGGVDVTARGVVPVGMAGLWMLAHNNNVSRVDNDAVECSVIVNDDFVNSLYASFANTGAFPDTVHMAVAATVVLLEEGDTVWAIIFPTGGDADAGAGASLLMTYLGPLVVDSGSGS